MEGVHIIPGKLVHIDGQKNGVPADSYEIYLKSFLDFYVLSEARKIYRVGTSFMYPSEFPVYAALVDDEYAGYVVCRVDSEVVWVESIFVKEEYRRHGVATALHSKAEEIAASYGDDTVYNYVHPNNHRMIEFLRKRGYTVLNLIEIRKPYKDEKLTQTIAVGEHEFDY